MFKIDKSFAIPESRIGRKPKYPWRDMQAGDSFFVPFEGGDAVKVRNSVNSAARRVFGRGNYTSRTMTNGGVEGLRVWRLG